MKIEWLDLESFRSFRRPGRIPFAPHRTVIVGKNNAGKTALLEALAGAEIHDPHRSAKTVRRVGTQPPPTERRLCLSISPDDVERCHLEQRSAFTVGYSTDATEAKASWEHIEREGCTILGDRDRWQGSYTDIEANVNYSKYVTFRPLVDGPPQMAHSGGGPDVRDLLFASVRKHSLFRFRAERITNGRCESSKDATLSSDAANLPAALFRLQNRDSQSFAELQRIVHAVLPAVHSVQVEQRDGLEVEIMVWPHEPSTGRPDLAVPLERCGTGVSQVLAIVCALLTADAPKAFLVDEPNSFLHPSAIYELLELFSAHSEHQYIVATHSPEVIAAFDPERIIQLELEYGETKVTMRDPKELEDQRRILQDVGARLSSVFGADRIFWVEGDTEEQTFSHIVRHFAPYALRGCRILRVADTGSFDGRRVEASVKLYEKLSTGAALVPPAVGFFFDREGRSDEDVRRIRGRVPVISFTKRRMTESYLLHAGAIAAVLREHGASATAEQVQHKLDQDRGARDVEAWLSSVHAAKLLGAMFDDLSEYRVGFTKPGAPVRLVRWLLENVPEHLRPLFDEIVAIFSRGDVGRS